MNSAETDITRQDFFVVAGVPRAGTTSLCRFLSTVPGICFSRTKETNHFLPDGWPYPRITSWSDYQQQFDHSDSARWRGEGSPEYFYSDWALNQLKQTFAKIKIIVVLRDPVKRAYSEYLWLKQKGYEHEKNFESACAAEKSRKQSSWPRPFFYVDSGRYSERLKLLFDVFSRESVLTVLFEDLVENPEPALNAVLEFLNLEDAKVERAIPASNKSREFRTGLFRRMFSNDSSVQNFSQKIMPVRRWQKYIYYALLADSPELSQAGYQLTRELLQEDIDKTAKLINRDLNAVWKYESA